MISAALFFVAGFAPDLDKVEFFKALLQEEQDKAQRAEQAKLDLEARCRETERERDIYRLLARRWQSRLHAVLEEQRDRVSSAGYTTSASAALQAEVNADGDEDYDEEGGTDDDDDAMMDEDDHNMEDVDDEDNGHNGVESSLGEEVYFSCSQADHESSIDDQSVEMSDVEDRLDHPVTSAVGNIEPKGKVRAVSIAREDL